MRMNMSDAMPCFVSLSRGMMIDTAPDGRGTYSGETLAEVRVRYEDAEEMSLGAFCQWKAAQQDTPILWDETTEEQYYDMLGVLPPALIIPGGFLVGEPDDHHAESGQPRFRGYRCTKGKFLVSSRPLTRTEFRAEVAK